MAKHVVKVTDTLRETIKAAKDAGVSRYAIFLATGVDQGTLSRFINRQRGLDGSSIDLLAEYFELELKPARKRRAAKDR